MGTSHVIRLRNEDGALDASIAYKTHHSAGFDIPASEQVTLYNGEPRAIPTGLYIDQSYTYVPVSLGIYKPSLFPELQIRSRSGLAIKHNIFVLNAPGTIDADYPGEIKVILMNLGKQPFIVEKGMRIAQGVFTYFTHSTLHIDEAERTGGFGSTGL